MPKTEDSDPIFLSFLQRNISDVCISPGTFDPTGPSTKPVADTVEESFRTTKPVADTVEESFRGIDRKRNANANKAEVIFLLFILCD